LADPDLRGVTLGKEVRQVAAAAVEGQPGEGAAALAEVVAMVQTEVFPEAHSEELETMALPECEFDRQVFQVVKLRYPRLLQKLANQAITTPR